MSHSIAFFCGQFIRIFITLTWPVSEYVLNFLYGLLMGSTKQLPPIDNKILLLPAIELAEKIRKKELSCEEVMKAYVERSRAVHPFINAATDERYEDALKDAKKMDAFLASGSKSEEEIARDTPLLGVPFTCKEAIGVKDMKQNCGLVRYKDHIAEEDSDTAALYRKAGGIPVTVTNVPELCMWWESANHVSGVTKSPYDIRRTVGGSSGGEAAILTSAGAVIGIGNDLAGSIRMPSSFCGIYGHKPSRGLVSNYGDFPFSQMEPNLEDRTSEFVSTGPMCRYAEDLPLLVRILSDYDQRLEWDAKVDFKKIKVYYIEEFPGLLHNVEPDIKRAVRKAVSHFQDEYGIKPISIRFPELKYAFNMWECKLLEYGGRSFVSYMQGEDEHINLWWELFKNIFQKSEHTFPAIYYGMVDRRNKDKFYDFCLEQYKELERKLKDLFKDVDAVLLVPTHPKSPPHYLMTIPMYPNIAYTCIFSILGLPSTQIPAGCSGGLPIGIQAISGYCNDPICVATAIELDKVFNGWISPCPISV